MILSLRTLKIMAYLGLVFCLTSCGNKKQIKTYNIQVIVFEALGKKAKDPIPKTWIDLTASVCECDTMKLRPHPLIIRVDKMQKELSLATDLSSRAGNLNNPKLVKRLVRNELNKMKIGAAMADPQSENLDKARTIQEFVKNKRFRNYFFSSDKGMMQEEFMGQKIYLDIPSLLTKIHKDICEVGIAPIQVFLNPGESESEVVAIPAEDTPTRDASPKSSSLRNDLLAIGNHKQPVMDRLKMVGPLLKQHFSTKQRIVKTIGKNGTIVQTLKAEAYLEDWLAVITTLSDLEIMEIIQDEKGKIQEISIKETHQSSR